ncbi:TetR/AcrR family transcriptional regulator [Dactylosporangium sp. CA-092794]|uniref:TetR/AcrR family transcriptional regulator n=1 Tax=Dactylosporangium sp. CA-092794 TaxID=3239929 RepID=UPI003D8F8F25
MEITTQRRRGAELEAALLDAVWAELAEKGYLGLTMEGVAARASTGKQVLYRRWPSRPQMVLAAVRHRWSSLADDLPDTGSLREDVLVLMGRMAQRFDQLGPDLINGLLADADAGEAMPEAQGRMAEAMAAVLSRAVARGEADPARLTPRVATLPSDLLRHELLLYRHRPTTQTITEIVDDIFLPLVARHPESFGA